MTPTTSARWPSVAALGVLAAAENVAFITGGATVIAALVVGGFAAWFADKRLSKQFKDSAERQQRELIAEAQRQEAALAHDRELADLADLRIVLDEAAVAIAQANRATRSAIASMAVAQLGGRQDVDEWVKTTGAELEGAQSALLALSARLRVRLGAMDDITTSLVDAAGALQDVSGHALAFHAIEPEKKHSEGATDASKRFSEAAATFHNAAVRRTGTVIPR